MNLNYRRITIKITVTIMLLLDFVWRYLQWTKRELMGIPSIEPKLYYDNRNCFSYI